MVVLRSGLRPSYQLQHPPLELDDVSSLKEKQRATLQAFLDGEHAPSAYEVMVSASTLAGLMLFTRHRNKAQLSEVITEAAVVVSINLAALQRAKESEFKSTIHRRVQLVCERWRGGGRKGGAGGVIVFGRILLCLDPENAGLLLCFQDVASS